MQLLNLNRIPLVGSRILLAYMPLHVFLAQSLSLITGGLEAWKLGKDVLLLLLVLFTICLVLVQGKMTRIFRMLLMFAAVYGLLHLLLWAVHPEIYDRSAAIGIVYNMRLPLLLLLGYTSVMILPKFVFSSVIKVVLGISTVVAGLGVIQFFVPPDILFHFGYGVERGARAAFMIDDQAGLLRVMSTLREPNALGAYLIVPITTLSFLFLRYKDLARRQIIGGLLGLHVLALFLTFSRSSWLASVLVILIVIAVHFREQIKPFTNRYWPMLAGAVIVLVVGLFSLRDTHIFQQYIVHSNPTETVQDLDSNDYHWLFIRQGLEGIIDQPFGHGPGTAGLASIQNPAGSFLTENYYVQIGYELGVTGLVLFVLLNVWLYIALLRRGNRWTVVLLASFWGYMLTNMLLHTWSNEAVATQWWLLAGMLLATGGGDKAKKLASVKTADVRKTKKGKRLK
ncbi:MAG TPA: O-antigen ligase family protein [Candidatus Saccharimonadales bacterium]